MLLSILDLNNYIEGYYFSKTGGHLKNNPEFQIVTCAIKDPPPPLMFDPCLWPETNMTAARGGVSSSQPGPECCMCGDCGLPYELFQCKACHFRSQHRYPLKASSISFLNLMIFLSGLRSIDSQSELLAWFSPDIVATCIQRQSLTKSATGASVMTSKKNHTILLHQLETAARMTARKRRVTIKQVYQRAIEVLCSCKSIAPSRNKGLQRDHRQSEGDSSQMAD